MHWNIEQVLWALVLAAHMVLLVALLGRDRTKRFPWFSTAIVISTIELIADHLLHGKLTSFAFYWQSYSLILAGAIVGILVLVEISRHVFSSGKAGKILNARGWIGGTMVTVALAIAAVWFWGPWPAWKALSSEPKELPLLLVVLSAMKGQLFLAILTVEFALVLRIFGKRFGSAWGSQDQQIALGLSTYALGFLAVQATTDIIKHNVHLTSRDQYDHIVRLFTNLDNARFALWFLVLVWWIVWLWRDEPATDPGYATGPITAETPVLAGPPPLEESVREHEEGEPDSRD
jgi:hypothetical protein